MQHDIHHECHRSATVHDEDFHRIAHRLVNPEDNSVPESPEEILGCSTGAISHGTYCGAAATESVRVQEVDIVVQRLSEQTYARNTEQQTLNLMQG